jgi:hypothetical protein
MKKHLGIFYFDTNTHLQKRINKHNYTLLKDQFETVIIVDISSEYSISLKKELNLDTYYIIKNITYKKIDIQLYVYQRIDYEQYDYITWIDSGNLFIHSITSYLNYMSDHSFYTFMDSFENGEYQYSFSVYSIHQSCIGKYISLLKEVRNTYTKENQMWDVIQKEIPNRLSSCMPYLKLGYNEDLFEKNIFLDVDHFYKKLMDMEVISYIPVVSFMKRRERFQNGAYNELPPHFDIAVYRTHEDLKHLETDDAYCQHYLKHGQFEMRKCSHDMEYILPSFLRNCLAQYDLLHYFDVHSTFNLVEYQQSLKNISFENTKEYIIHWLENGIYQGKQY